MRYYVMKIKHRLTFLPVCMGLAIFLFCALNIDAKIVFTAKIKHAGDTLYHIYAMEDNGSNLRRITNPNRYDIAARWFPDGKQIVFERDWGFGKWNTGNTMQREFFIIDETGENEHSFMDNHRKDTSPVPSPDGRYILFDSSRDNKYLDIYSYDLVRKKLNQLTHNNTIEDGYTQDASWSPDGNKVIYHNSEEEDSIWIMDSDGDRKERFTPWHQGNTFLNRAYPRWSPSGKYIMYIEIEFVNDPFKVIANRLIIQNVFTDRRTIHKFSVEGGFGGLAWMGNDETVLLSYKDQSNTYNIYHYDLNSRKMTQLTDFPIGHALFPHWVEGSLSVSPQDKMTTSWGHLKQKP